MNGIWTYLAGGMKLLWGSFAFLMNFTAIVFFCGLVVFAGAKALGCLYSFFCYTVSKISADKISLDKSGILQQLFLMANAILFFILWLLLVGKTISWFGLDNIWKAGFFHFH